MDDSLKNLEKRLAGLAPRGLSDDGRERLEDQLDSLAREVAETSPSKPRFATRALGIAAALGAMGGLFLLTQEGREPGTAGTSVREGAADDPIAEVIFETLGLDRQVKDGRDGGYVLNSFNQPMRSWKYSVQQVQSIKDSESGYEIEIESQQEEVILTAVTSF